MARDGRGLDRVARRELYRRLPIGGHRPPSMSDQLTRGRRPLFLGIFPNQPVSVSCVVED